MKFLIDFIRFVKLQEKKYSILNLSAQLSYRVLLAVIPFMMLLYNFLNWFSTKLNSDLLHNLKIVFPNFIDEFIHTATLNASGPQTSNWANIVFGFFILYASVCAIRSLILTLNKVMNIPEKRHYFTIWGISIVYLFIFIFFIMLVLYLYLSTQYFITAFFTSLNWSDYFIRFWRGFSLLYLITICILLLTGAYMFIPSKHQSFFSALPGAVFVC
ncbi:MAG: YhjD/YihY/BrkB family envelope integrity protein, partial [Eubacterium sp.]